jgi:serine/threonine protein kinase
MDHLEGGELFKLLVKMNRVSVSTARLYAAEILIALQYIHASGHVYRDLKPENVLLTADGHLVSFKVLIETPAHVTDPDWKLTEIPMNYIAGAHGYGLLQAAARRREDFHDVRHG